jgi:adenylylsulfate reductase subunit A
MQTQERLPDEESLKVLFEDYLDMTPTQVFYWASQNRRCCYGNY